MGRQGVPEVILEKKPPIPGGYVIGFEPLVFAYCLSCLWPCNGLEAKMEEAPGINPFCMNLSTALTTQ